MEKQPEEKEVKGGEEMMEKITCIHCGYSWETRSDKLFVSCPSCLKKTPTRMIAKPSLLVENGKQ